MPETAAASPPNPPHDWASIRWGGDPEGWNRALDRRAAAGCHRTARAASAARDRYADRRGVSGAGPPPCCRTPFPRPSCRSSRWASPPSTPIFPGTVTLSTNVALKSWMELGSGVAAAGIRKLVMVTSHGGNSAAMITGGAGSARPARSLLRGHHSTGIASASRTACSQRGGNPPWRARRRDRNLDHAGGRIH